MLLKFRTLLYSLIFLAGLELVVAKPNWVVLVVVILFFISLVEGRRMGKSWLFSVLPVFFTLSSTALLYLIASFLEQQVFIFLSSIMYYFSLFGAFRLGEYRGDQTARGMNMAAALATIFFAYASAYGLYLNFLVPLWLLMLTYLLVTFFVSFQYFSIIEIDKIKIWVYSLLLALIMAEIIWTMNFWPFGYLTTGVIALILYYILWDLSQIYLLNILSKRRVVANMIFFSIIIVCVLLSAKWIPVI